MTTAPSATSSGLSPSSTEPPAGLASWSALAPTGVSPFARSGQTWTVDPSSAVAYLFAGRGVEADLDDLWAYDLTADAWQPLDPVGPRPSARHDQAAAWLDDLGLVVFGGRTDAGVLDDLWAYDPMADGWRTLDAVGDRPSARAGACAAVRADGRLWLHGGVAADGTTLTDTWVYDPGPSRWTVRQDEGEAPAGRSGAACWWSPDDRFVIHGGATSAGMALGDTWTLPAASSPAAAWTSVDPGLPPRAHAAAAIRGDGAVLAGGLGADGSPRSDLVMFDARTLAATRLDGAPGGPVARSGASLVDDPGGERMVLFGGDGQDGPFDDLWALDLP